MGIIEAVVRQSDCLILPMSAASQAVIPAAASQPAVQPRRPVPIANLANKISDLRRLAYKK